MKRHNRFHLILLALLYVLISIPLSSTISAQDDQPEKRTTLTLGDIRLYWE